MKLLALATPAILLWTTPARADAPPARAPVAAAPATDAPIVRPAVGLVLLARLATAIATATQATAPMCDGAGRPLAGNVGKSSHTCSLDERVTYALLGPR